MTVSAVTSRTNRAYSSVIAYGDDLGDDEIATAAQDMIVDLLHLAEQYGVTPAEMPDYMRVALDHYEYESDPDNASEEV